MAAEARATVTCEPVQPGGDHVAPDPHPQYDFDHASKPLPPVPDVDAAEEANEPDPPSFSSIFASIPPGVDLNTTASLPKEIRIPAVFLGIPFPPAEHARDDDKHLKKRPTLLLYAPPRAPYRKPQPDENGKTKQELVKRVERKWQEEVAQGQRIHDGQEANASRWKRTKGPFARKAAQFIQWLPDSTLEALTRIPPKKKLNEAIVFVPEDPEYSSPEKKAGLEQQLEQERKGAIKRTWISGLLLPVTETIDFFNPVPIFAFEVNLAYFAFQLQGLRKATALNSDDVQLRLEPSTHLAPLQARLRALCNARTQQQVPSADEPDLGPGLDEGRTAPGRAGGRALAEAIVAVFTAAVPPEVAGRHALDDLEALADDIERCLQKGAKEYIKSL
ncbi:hypothetical protein PUNSTDRAFT_140725 [Punctularia strigosozonata HHB-11173 SS5]|uniref:uncharacterized protein n=1 Tax=Punctularia strigosozonata (strain HHB-11173) TaxID=741275 RepID=UPI000441628C|nr:uncharacterized protein PUNSTDRAFT_140725 [Punctularia strigosozonata HHB-11173 SS5]EIN14428.1 hypothetical protein PUNSTDRAFT_140725 [Punctularia strigosozonata HHB-11173 SS5]